MENEAQKTKSLTIKDAFDDVNVKKKFREMLGQKAPGFMVSVINAVSNNDMLKNADRNSIIFAAATAATLELPINPNLGFAAIVPYYDGKTKTTKAQFQIMTKGFVQLALRSGQFRTLNSCEIHEGELVEENPLTGYVFDFSKRTSDKIIGYASFFKLINGFEKTIYMSVEQIEKHGKKYSQSFKKGYGLWVDDFGAMALKTITKQNLSKNAPLSIEMQKAVLTDQAVINDWEGEKLEYDDNESNKKLSVEEVAEDKEKQRVLKHINDSKTLEKLEEAWDYVEDLSDDNEVKIAYGEKQKSFTTEEVKEEESDGDTF